MAGSEWPASTTVVKYAPGHGTGRAQGRNSGLYSTARWWLNQEVTPCELHPLALVFGVPATDDGPMTSEEVGVERHH
jgi:hypothetical protein